MNKTLFRHTMTIYRSCPLCAEEPVFLLQTLKKPSIHIERINLEAVQAPQGINYESARKILRRQLNIRGISKMLHRPEHSR